MNCCRKVSDCPRTNDLGLDDAVIVSRSLKSTSNFSSFPSGESVLSALGERCQFKHNQRVLIYSYYNVQIWFKRDAILFPIKCITNSRQYKYKSIGGSNSLQKSFCSFGLWSIWSMSTSWLNPELPVLLRAPHFRISCRSHTYKPPDYSISGAPVSEQVFLGQQVRLVE